MVEYSGPWDSSDFNEDRWRQLLGSSFNDGVLRNDDQESDGLLVERSTSDRTITVTPGKARVQGHLYVNDADITFNSPVPTAGTQRIDYVVLRFDPTQPLADRIKAALVIGQETSSSPSAPSLTQVPDGVWEFPQMRIGPYGDGPIGDAPYQWMRLGVTPVDTLVDHDPNDRLEAMSRRRHATVITTGGDNPGRIWKYNYHTGAYQRLGDIERGEISTSDEFENRYSSRHRLSYEFNPLTGLVMISGYLRYSGFLSRYVPYNSYELPLSAALPIKIRPRIGSNTFLMGVAAMSKARSVEPNDDPETRREPIRVTYREADSRLYMTRLVWDTRYINISEVVYFDSLTWYADID